MRQRAQYLRLYLGTITTIEALLRRYWGGIIELAAHACLHTSLALLLASVLLLLALLLALLLD
jgi:hypothetical protein